MVSTTSIIIGIALFFSLEFFILAPLVQDSFTWGLINGGDINSIKPNDVSQGDYDVPTGSIFDTLHPISYLGAIFSLFSFGVNLPPDYPTTFIVFVSIINYFCLLALILAIYILVRSGTNA
jgi:hypothetical protein